MMKIKAFVFILFLLLSCKNTGVKKHHNNQGIVDDLGNIFSTDSIPKRVITLAPNLTEMIYALNAGNKLIGNTSFCNFPKEANNVEKVGDLLTINYEKILDLNPDMIFLTVEGNSKEGYNRLKELGFNVFISNPRDFKGIKKTFSDLSRILKKEKLADSILTDWEKRLAKIEKAADNNTGFTGMFLISLKPIMLAGKNTYINEFLKTCGLNNISADTDVNYPVFSREQVLIRNPDYIFYSAGMNKNEAEIKNAYPEWSKLSAFKNGNLFFIDADLYFRPGPRFILALEDFADKISLSN